MAITAPQSLFDWSQIENFGDLERLKLILRHIPDEPLMQLLEKQLRSRRLIGDEYPSHLRTDPDADFCGWKDR